MSEAEYSRIARSAVSSATRSERVVSGRSPASQIFQTPYSWLWLYSVQPWSKRVSSALPCGSMARIRRPGSVFAWRLSAGNANHADTSGLPATASASRSAARRISGPSGMGSHSALSCRSLPRLRGRAGVGALFGQPRRGVLAPIPTFPRERGQEQAGSVQARAHQRGDGMAIGCVEAGQGVRNRDPVGNRMVLVELELEFDAHGFEAEADDPAQLPPVVFALVLEAPGLADAGFETVAHPGHQVGQRRLVLERLQRARQVRHRVVPGGYARRILLVRIPAGRDVGVRAVHDQQRGTGVAGLRIGPGPVAFDTHAFAVATVQHGQVAGER